MLRLRPAARLRPRVERAVLRPRDVLLRAREALLRPRDERVLVRPRDERVLVRPRDALLRPRVELRPPRAVDRDVVERLDRPERPRVVPPRAALVRPRPRLEPLARLVRPRRDGSALDERLELDRSARLEVRPELVRPELARSELVRPPR